MEIHPKIGLWNSRDERLNRSAVSVQLHKQMSYVYWEIYIYNISIHLWLHFKHIIYIHIYIYDIIRYTNTNIHIIHSAESFGKTWKKSVDPSWYREPRHCWYFSLLNLPGAAVSCGVHGGTFRRNVTVVHLGAVIYFWSVQYLVLSKSKGIPKNPVIFHHFAYETFPF